MYCLCIYEFGFCNRQIASVNCFGLLSCFLGLDDQTRHELMETAGVSSQVSHHVEAVCINL